MATERGAVTSSGGSSIASEALVAGYEAMSSPASAASTTASSPHALGGYGVLWVSRPAILDRIATWGSGRRARSQATDVDRRLAVGAATALAELVQGSLTGSPVPWERMFAVDVADLADRMGVWPPEAGEGLDWLVRIGAAVPEPTTRSSASGKAGQFRIPEELWAPALALSVIAWPDVRRQLRDQGGRLAPALAVLRALADRPEAMRAAAAVAGAVAGREDDARADSGGNSSRGNDQAWGKTSVAHLVNATLFGRSAVLDALGRLEATGIIARRRFPGSHEGDEVQLRPKAFGRPNAIDESAEPSARSPAAGVSASSSTAVAVPRSTSVGAEAIRQPAQQASQASTEPGRDVGVASVEMTIAGIVLCVPLGTRVTMGVDDAGHRVVHVGDDIVIGSLQ